MFINPSVLKLNPTTNQESSQDQQRSLIFVIAFVVGFSERLAKDFIGKAEEIAGANRDNLEYKQVTNELSVDVDGSNISQKQVANSIAISNTAPNQVDSDNLLNGQMIPNPKKIKRNTVLLCPQKLNQDVNEFRTGDSRQTPLKK